MIESCGWFAKVLRKVEQIPQQRGCVWTERLGRSALKWPGNLLAQGKVIDWQFMQSHAWKIR